MHTYMTISVKASKRAHSLTELESAISRMPHLSSCQTACGLPPCQNICRPPCVQVQRARHRHSLLPTGAKRTLPSTDESRSSSKGWILPTWANVGPGLRDPRPARWTTSNVTWPAPKAVTTSRPRS